MVFFAGGVIINVSQEKDVEVPPWGVFQPRIDTKKYIQVAKRENPGSDPVGKISVAI